MFDVGQNTARINSLLAIYYQAEAEVENCTEAKLGLTLQASALTKEQNNKENAIIDKYAGYADALAAGQVPAVQIPGGSIQPKTSGSAADQSLSLQETDFKSQFEAAYPRPEENQGEFAHINKNQGEYTHKSDADFKSQAKANVGSAPVAPDQGDSKYQKTVEKEVQNDDGTTSKQQTKEFDQSKYDSDMAEYNRKKTEYEDKVNREANRLADEENKRLDEQVDKYNDKLDEKCKSAQKKWDSALETAIGDAKAIVSAMNGQANALNQKRSNEMTKMQNEYENMNEDLSMQECQLDQQIQQAQAVVTATKTEIDSLKQERNSNAQSDFKLFG